MTLHEKLDSILNGYLAWHVLKLKGDPRHKNMTFSLAVKTLCPDTEEWEKAYLRDRLINDGYLEAISNEDLENLELTQKGIDFITENGYVGSQNEIKKDRKIKDATLNSLKHSKWALIISIFAIIIPAIISVYVFQESKHQPNRQELEELRKRIEKLDSLIKESNKDTVSTLENGSDLLKKVNKI
jgi:predicted transcriptional regulator